MAENVSVQICFSVSAGSLSFRIKKIDFWERIPED